jgi:hypothetical protein
LASKLQLSDIIVVLRRSIESATQSERPLVNIVAGCWAPPTAG